jgi:serpin B
MKKTLIPLSIIAVVMIGGASFEEGTPSADISAVIDANSQFAFDIYSELNREEGNLFFSPYSISVALAMVYEGARGTTAEEIQSVFHFPTESLSRRTAFAAIHRQLNAANATYTLSVANALWAQHDYKFLDEYLNTLRHDYAGEATNVDFQQATEAARETINHWVEENTKQKIKDLFPPGSLDDMTRLVLTNAVYFKGTWVRQFDNTYTRDEDFRVNPTTTLKVPMMRHATDEGVTFRYAETETLQVLEMPYEGETLSMLVLLPKNDDLTALENSLSTERLKEWNAKLTEQDVVVFMPKFMFNSKYFLNDMLATMGMPTAFTDKADFSGMDGTRNLFIQTAIHQAFVDVNEEGTEAAAATGVSVKVASSGPPVPIFRADHPFLFIIRDARNGQILFFGRVINPLVTG